MFNVILTVVAHFVLVAPVGIPLQANLSEPADVQPALGVNVYQRTVQAGELQRGLVVGQYQPAARFGVYQNTVDVYQLQ